tara:strand:+ start:871 stop:2262 length:1392 start_codon:yes stop_codon:yes gene_type:complete
MPSLFEPTIGPGPPEKLMQRLREGYVLTTDEMEQLNRTGEEAARLEYSDPNFARAARKWRAEHQEQARLDEMRKMLAAKKNAENKQDAARARDIKARREEREAREEQLRQQRDAHFREEEEKRQALADEIALSQRRAMVRETIKQALVKQSQKEATSAINRDALFNTKRTSDDTPGPGHYEQYQLPVRAASFEHHNVQPVRRPLPPRPGPGSYDPKIPTTATYSFGVKHVPPPVGHDSPGPAAYCPQVRLKPGGTISKHTANSYLDKATEHSALVPGPGSYDPDDNSRWGSKSASLYGRNPGQEEMALREAAQAPGPGSYDEPRRRIRGGVMGEDSRDKIGQGGLLGNNAHNPGPSAYFHTPTIAQERELRRLSKKVVGMVTQRQKQSAAALGASGGGAASSPAVAPPPPIRAASRLQPSGGGSTFITDRSSACKDSPAAAGGLSKQKSRLGLGSSCSMPALV